MNKRMLKAVHAVIAFVIVLSFPGYLHAEQGRAYLDVSAGFSTGDFGTPVRSDLYSVSTALGYVTPVYQVSALVPILFLSNSGFGTTRTESGIGDIILRGGRVLVPETKNGFSLDGSLSLKLPTASRSKGLGTGETDYGAFLGMYQRIDKTKLYVHAGYIFVGQPQSLALNDVYLYGFGISQVIDRTELYASFEGRRALFPGEKKPQEIWAGFFHILNVDYAVKASTFFGLNNGGPDFGLNFGIVRWF